MYKVLIADDEPLINKGLKYLINWKEYGLEIVYSAKDGMDAFYAIKKYGTDILITDIRMPVLDGLELIRKTQEISPHTRYIVLSGYDDFKYLKESIKLGIDNYILKPVDKGELISTLSSTINKMENSFRFEMPSSIITVNDEIKSTFKHKQEIAEFDKFSPMVKRILEYIHFNFHKDISIKTLAHKINTNPNYLGHIFKEETGEFFSDYLNLHRVNKAKELLLNTKYKNYEISKLVGYIDPSYFHRVFKKYTGLSPSEFRIKSI
ncbi:UNVERIFIED_CONTAM: two-component system response regulator YesN [Acetivibrio alkalicellulosi]